MKGKQPSDLLDLVKAEMALRFLFVGTYSAGIDFPASLPPCFSCAFHVNPLQLNESIKFH